MVEIIKRIDQPNLEKWLWANYLFMFSDMTEKERNEIEEWCKSFLNGKWKIYHHRNTFLYMATDEDFMISKLRW